MKEYDYHYCSKHVYETFQTCSYWLAENFNLISYSFLMKALAGYI